MRTNPRSDERSYARESVDPIVFSAAWFARHQGKLLWLLNHWLTRRWFRWVLCIRKHDIGYDKPILELLPHAYTVLLHDPSQPSTLNPQPLLATDFRTHPKYAKRLHYAFNPLWWLLHGWDYLLADRWLPRWSFGFATFTVYPDPSFGAITTDGIVMRTGVDESFATIRAGAGNNSDIAAITDGPQLMASATSNQFDTLTRAILTFNTATLGTSVQTAILSLSGVGKNNTLGDTTVNISIATPTDDNDLHDADYSQCGSSSLQSISYASYSDSAYNDFTLSATDINGTGITRFGARLGWDIAASFTGAWSSGNSSWFYWSSADTGGTSSDPKLVVTYMKTGRFMNQTNNLRPRFFRPGLAR